MNKFSFSSKTFLNTVSRLNVVHNIFRINGDITLMNLICFKSESSNSRQYSEKYKIEIYLFKLLCKQTFYGSQMSRKLENAHVFLSLRIKILHLKLIIVLTILIFFEYLLIAIPRYAPFFGVTDLILIIRG